MDNLDMNRSWIKYTPIHLKTRLLLARLHLLLIETRREISNNINAIFEEHTCSS
jgi:hypothetical protein